MPKIHKRNLSVVIWSFVDLIAQVLHLVWSSKLIQLIAWLATGATLFTSLSVTIRAHRLWKIVKPAASAIVNSISRSEKMEGFFSKIRASLKNNPITTAATIVDAALSGGGGYIYRYGNGN